MAREIRWGPLLVFELAFWVGLTGWGFVLEDVVAMRPSRRHLTLELRDGRSFSLRAADPEALRDAFEAVGAGVSDGEPVEEPVQLQDLRRRVGSAV